MARRFTTEYVSCEPVGMVERRREWRAGSRFLIGFKVESVFLHVRKYIALVPRYPSRTKIASLYAKCP